MDKIVVITLNRKINKLNILNSSHTYIHTWCRFNCLVLTFHIGPIFGHTEVVKIVLSCLFHLSHAIYTFHYIVCIIHASIEITATILSIVKNHVRNRAWHFFAILYTSLFDMNLASSRDFFMWLENTHTHNERCFNYFCVHVFCLFDLNRSKH